METVKLKLFTVHGSRNFTPIPSPLSDFLSSSSHIVAEGLLSLQRSPWAAPLALRQTDRHARSGRAKKARHVAADGISDPIVCPEQCAIAPCLQPWAPRSLLLRRLRARL